MEILIQAKMILYLVIGLFIIAIFDFFLVGRKLATGIKLSPYELVIFYFGRTTAEFIVFFIGIVVGLGLR